MLLFSVLKFFTFLDFCLCACLKLPLLSLEGWTPWSLSSVAISHVNTGGNLSLGFSRDHTSLAGLFTEHCNTSFENTVGEGDPYLLHRDTYSVETEVRFLFSTAPLTIVPCSVLRKREMRKAFVSQLLLECFSCVEDVEVKGGASLDSTASLRRANLNSNLRSRGVLHIKRPLDKMQEYCKS